MCGRFTVTVSASVLASVFDLDLPLQFEPRYNVAPTQVVPVIRTGRSGRREWAPCRWGLIPAWAKDPAIGNRMINARSETAADKASFRRALAVRRCLIPADGFYEWAKTPGGKQPYHLRFSDRRVFSLAGLWERWDKGPDGPVDSFTILTTAPNAVAAAVHDRMPVIVAPDDRDDWLDPAPLAADRREKIFAPFPADGMKAVPVSKRVNSPANDDPECLEELAESV